MNIKIYYRQGQTVISTCLHIQSYLVEIGFFLALFGREQFYRLDLEKGQLWRGQFYRLELEKGQLYLVRIRNKTTPVRIMLGLASFRGVCISATGCVVRDSIFRYSWIYMNWVCLPNTAPLFVQSYVLQDEDTVFENIHSICVMLVKLSVTFRSEWFIIRVFSFIINFF